MGAWGTGAFENDAALDLLLEYEEGGVLALHGVLSEWDDIGEDGYADGDIASATLAIGEIVVACHGGAVNVAEQLASQIATHKEAVASDTALLAAVRTHVTLGLLEPEKSELADLWGEAAPEDNAAFQASVHSLIERLKGIAG